MARIRSIKPEFWSDEKLSECSLSARLLFIGLWTFADDEGRAEYQPARIRMQVFPCGSVNLVKVRELLGELTERSLIRVYVVDSKEYLDIPNFAKHQRINRPTASKLPAFLTEHSVSSQGGLTLGVEKEKEGSRQTHKPSKSRKTPIPDSFALSEGMSQYAQTKIPDANVSEMFAGFCDKAKAKGWAYVDWEKAWQEFVRNCAPNSGHWAQGQYPKVNGSGGLAWR